MKPTFIPPSTKIICKITLATALISFLGAIACLVLSLAKVASSDLFYILFTCAMLIAIVTTFFACKERLRGNYTVINLNIILALVTIAISLVSLIIRLVI
ncbi:MAG: hypothetical protein E7353_10045 [Clostridiales bacterium]|nr:hypothetical protein [Clostridiales bacterium]